MSSQTNLRALGLNTQPNRIDLPDGSLIEAKNVVINRDNVIEQRRGLKIYGESFGSISDRAKQILAYKNRLLTHYANKLAFDSDGSGDFELFAGNYTEAQTGLRIKGIESNGNFYFTTSDGIKKISAKTASDFSTSAGYVTDAGGVKALDLIGNIIYSPNNQSGFLPQDSAVAYRVLWSIIDANENLVQGTPSQRFEIYNPLTELLVQDYLRVLSALDSLDQGASLITDGDYVNTLKLPVTASASDIRNSLITLTQKLDNDIFLANNSGVGVPLTIASASVPSNGTVEIVFSAGDATDYFVVGSKIGITDFTSTGVDINGPQVVSLVTSTTVEFNVVGTLVADSITVTNGKIHSNEYRSITIPAAPDSPSTNAQNVTVQEYLEAIITRLLEEPDAIIPTALATQYLDSLGITSSATVKLFITVPEEITSNYFLQIYRSSIAQATGTTVLADLVPNDEMQLVYEAYPTTQQLIDREIVVDDVTPDAFRGANLYTNEATGEGLAQANDLPPFALDINRFKGSIFYANTRTRHRKLLSLLGVTDIPNGSKLIIANNTTSNVYTFVLGVQEVTQIQFGAAEAAGNTLRQTAVTASYFLLNSANDLTKYYVWFSNGTTLVPTVSDIPDIAERTPIIVEFLNADTNAEVAAKTRDKIAVYVTDFITSVNASPNSNQLIVTNVVEGIVTDATSSGSGLTVTIITQGDGEDYANNKVLLSSLVSAAQAVDVTAKSLIRVINKNPNEIVNGYYLSTANTVPGRIFLEARDLELNAFYLLADNSDLGESFSPNLSPSYTNISNTAANPTVVTWTSHGLITGDKVIIVNSDSTPSIDGVSQVIVLSANTFSIPINVTVAGTQGSALKLTESEASDNEVKPNRVYYSKNQQPEAVPITNYISLGAEDKPILRIFPLRDSLFVFKEDGLYRISGESIPFVQGLFDSSCLLLAPDSVDVANNIVYCWTKQGVQVVSEAGVSTLSRPIEDDILKLQTTQYTNFKTATWGVGYESDNSYLVFTVQRTSDEVATICYRFNNITNTWTNFMISKTCGHVLSIDDRLYVGCSDVNNIEQERKEFNRYDHADREFNTNIQDGQYFGNNIKLTDVTNISAGDVITQDQKLTVYEYNMLLRKLDNDPGVADNDYYSLLSASAGTNLEDDLTALATKLDADTGVSFTGFSDIVASITGTITVISNSNPTIITTSAPHDLVNGRLINISGSNSQPSVDGQHQVIMLSPTTFSIPVNVLVAGSAGTFQTVDSDFLDIEACYNGIIDALNNDTNVVFSNYRKVDTTTIQEMVVVSVNKNIKQVTLNLALELVTGQLTIFKSIPSSVLYAPTTAGDAVNYKQIYEATVMFDSKDFTNARLKFASDLIPQFEYVPFFGDGNGIFGHGATGYTIPPTSPSGFGGGFFGGVSNAAPFRTYIPRNYQRCRYLVVGFEHTVAREKYAINGITLTGNNTGSSRAYRR